MTKRTNHLASKSELLKAQNRIPQGLRAYFELQAHQTLIFRQTVAQLIPKEMADLCQVVRYFNGELIVSSPNLTLNNHLHYLLPTLINTLKSHQAFAQLSTITLVHFCPT